MKTFTGLSKSFGLYFPRFSRSAFERGAREAPWMAAPRLPQSIGVQRMPVGLGTAARRHGGRLAQGALRIAAASAHAGRVATSPDAAAARSRAGPARNCTSKELNDG